MVVTLFEMNSDPKVDRITQINSLLRADNVQTKHKQVDDLMKFVMTLTDTDFEELYPKIILYRRLVDFDVNEKDALNDYINEKEEKMFMKLLTDPTNEKVKSNSYQSKANLPPIVKSYKRLSTIYNLVDDKEAADEAESMLGTYDLPILKQKLYDEVCDHMDRWQYMFHN